MANPNLPGSFLLGPHFHLKKQEVKKWSQKMKPGRSGFSSPRAFQWRSLDCRSPSGSLANWFVVGSYWMSNPAVAPGLSDAHVLSNSGRLSDWRKYRWIGPPADAHEKLFSKQTKRATYKKLETKNEKLSANKIQICQAYFCVIYFLTSFFKLTFLQLDCPSDGHWDVVGMTS